MYFILVLIRLTLLIRLTSYEAEENNN